ncbi:MAG: FIST signal transduction protein [Actinomycetota bacterium]
MPQGVAAGVAAGPSTPSPIILAGAGYSAKTAPVEAVREAFDLAAKQLGGRSIDLIFMFASPEHSLKAEELSGAIASCVAAIQPPEVARAEQNPSESESEPEFYFPRPIVLGCTAQGIISQDKEIEEGPALSIWMAHLPGAELHPFFLSIEYTADGMSLVGLPLFVPSFHSALVLSEPNSFPTQILLDGFNAEHQGMPIVGGQASGGGPGQNFLIVNDVVTRSGAVGVLVGGDVKLQAIVSQGCKPIGKPLIVTAAEGNVIHMLGGRPPLARLREAAAHLPPEEQAKILQNLQVGVIIDELKTNPGRGDFLVRGLLHADMESGAIAIGDVVRVGQTVQFQLRDAGTADEDLKSMLTAYGDDGAPSGALMFTCNGRGARLFGSPDHDAAELQHSFPGLATAGMFCAGEIGPIGGLNFLHGFTASIALFENSTGTNKDS